jgi:hypothetical protein
VVALGAGLITPEAAGVPRGNDKIDRATAALRADKAACPFGDRESGPISRGLFAGIDIDPVLTELAPGPQQQTRFAVVPSVAGPEALS